MTVRPVFEKLETWYIQGCVKINVDN